MRQGQLLVRRLLRCRLQKPLRKCGTDGQCEFLKPEEAPRLPCGSGDCAGSCSGSSGLCVFPDSTKLCERVDCPEGNCKTHCLEKDWVLEWTCDGTGQCVEGRSRPCGDYSCNDGECYQDCASDDQCRRAATCNVTAQGCIADGRKSHR